MNIAKRKKKKVYRYFQTLLQHSTFNENKILFSEIALCLEILPFIAFKIVLPEDNFYYYSAPSAICNVAHNFFFFRRTLHVAEFCRQW